MGESGERCNVHESPCYLPSVKLSVVIPALDEADEIAAAVASAGAEGVEIVVVDGGSCDATRERASAAGAGVLHSPPGRARQLGVGARETRGDVVLFLHADTRLPPGWDAAVRRALEDPTVVGGCFRFQLGARQPALRIVEWGARLRVRLFGMPYGDQALFVRRVALDAIGGVPQAPIMEDLDLVRAMKRHGRLAWLALPITTSPRRYLEHGALRTMLRNWAAVVAWLLGLERERIAAWYRR